MSDGQELEQFIAAGHYLLGLRRSDNLTNLLDSCFNFEFKAPFSHLGIGATWVAQYAAFRCAVREFIRSDVFRIERP
jgi:hypothetical protein